MKLMKKIDFLRTGGYIFCKYKETEDMSGIKNKEILRLLKMDIKASKLTQAEISKKLGIKPPFLSRLLSGKDPLSLDRASRILKMLPHSVNQERIGQLLAEEVNSAPADEKGEELKLNLLQKVESIGKDSYLSFILDFWVDMDEQEKIAVFKLFLDFIEKRSKGRKP